MAILPTRILEIEFDAGVWTNVTADLVTITSRRGRNRESGAFETGTLTFSLRNDARKYDPDNTAGTYYGKLRPNRRVRWRNTFNAVTYDCFVGYIDRIAQVGGGPNDATADFEASDFFKLLNRAELPASVYRAEVLDDTPRSWFPLDEPSGSTSVTDAVAGLRADVVGAGVTFGGASPLVRDPGGAMLTSTNPATAARSGIYAPALTGVAPTGTGDFSVEFWIATTQAVGNDIKILAQGQGSPEEFNVCLEGAIFAPFTRQFIRVNAWHGGAVSGTATTTITINDGAPHHVVVTRTAGIGRIYVDGVLDSATFGFTSDLRGDVFFGSPGSNVAFDESLIGATLTQLAYYNSALSLANVQAHNSAGRTPWNGDTPGTRLSRIFSLVATPGSYVLDAGEPTLQSTSLGGTVLGYAQKVEETTLGSMFVAKNGDVTFIGRNTLVTGAYLTSQATLVDDDSGAGIPYRRGDADVDEARIVTRATVSREGSVAVQVLDTAASTEFGWLDETHDGLLHDSDIYSRSYAEWIVNAHRTPGSRISTVTLELTANPTAMFPAILGLEIGQRVTWKRKAQNTGAVLSIDMRVEAIGHATGPGQYWTTTLQLSPFNIAGNPVGVWDTTLWDQSVWAI